MPECYKLSYDVLENIYIRNRKSKKAKHAITIREDYTVLRRGYIDDEDYELIKNSCRRIFTKEELHKGLVICIYDAELQKYTRKKY